MSWETADYLFQTAIVTNNLDLAKSVIHLVNANTYFSHRHELPLHLSVKNGNINLVKFLIENGANVNLMDRQYLFPLHYACLFVNPSIVKLLIDSGADPNVQSFKGQTPLLTAIESTSLELVKILVESGADIEIADTNDLCTPLHKACIKCHYEIVHYLISCGAKLNKRNRLGLTPLLTAILCNYSINIPIIKLLLRSGCDPNEANMAGLSPLLATIRRSSDHFGDGSEAVQALIDHGCNVNAREYEYSYPPTSSAGETALNISIDRNQDTITEKLIRNGANVSLANSRGETPLFALLRDRKYVLARQAIATLPLISLKDLHQLQYYLTDEYNMNEDRKNFEQIKKFILSKHWPYFPCLMHLCRCKIRQHLGRYSDKTIQRLHLPESIKAFLMLKQL